MGHPIFQRPKIRNFLIIQFIHPADVRRKCNKSTDSCQNSTDQMSPTTDQIFQPYYSWLLFTVDHCNNEFCHINKCCDCNHQCCGENQELNEITRNEPV